MNKGWKDSILPWSLKRILRYGYGRITIRGNTLQYQFITVPSGKVVDEWTITK